jgi:hypothetical protein
MTKILPRKEYIVFSLVLLFVVIIFVVITVNKNKDISELRKDLIKAQFTVILQHNDNEILQARLTDLEERSRQKK